jgi:tetratricopeptide (TPR) repeat protein
MVGLSYGIGRTVIVSGPPESGKSEFLSYLKGELEARDCRVLEARGNPKHPTAPFDAVEQLTRPPTITFDPRVQPASTPGSPAEGSGPDHRSDPRATQAARGPDPFRLTKYAPALIPARTAWDGQASEGGISGSFGERLARSSAVLIDDGTRLDESSRDILLCLSERVRVRPLLFVIALDNLASGYAGWETRLASRPDVDWIRFAHPVQGPEEANEWREAFGALPERTRSALGYVGLAGGSVRDTVLSYLTGRRWSDLSDALAPAMAAGLLRIEGRSLTIPWEPLVSAIPELLGVDDRERMHRRIVESILVSDEELDLSRRIALAQHFYSWRRGPEAYRYLCEVAEDLERMNAFDSAEFVTAQALTCAAPIEEGAASAGSLELRIQHVRQLFFTGRPSEAEAELSEVFAASSTEPDVAHWARSTEPLLPTLAAVGPRPGLLKIVDMAIDRGRSHGVEPVEVLFLGLRADLERQRGNFAGALKDAERAVRGAESLPDPGLVARSMMTEALVRIESAYDLKQAEEMLANAEALIPADPRPDLLAKVHELRATIARLQGSSEKALAEYREAVQVSRESGLLAAELDPQLGIAQTALDLPDSEEMLVNALTRCEEIVAQLHLVPPAPGLLLLRLLQGRSLAYQARIEAAQECWQFLVDLPKSMVPPALRREAAVGLMVLKTAYHDRSVVPKDLSRSAGFHLKGNYTRSWQARVEALERTLFSREHSEGS